MDTTITDRVTAHVDYVQRLLTLCNLTGAEVQDLYTRGNDTSTPTVGRLAFIGTVIAPRVAEIVKVTPTRIQVGYFTESGIRHGRSLAAYNSYPVQFDSWPETYRDRARIEWRANPGRTLKHNALTEDDYAEYHYEWALKTQAVYRAVKHCPWVAFAPIRHGWIRRHHLVMIPENGDNE